MKIEDKKMPSETPIVSYPLFDLLTVLPKKVLTLYTTLH